METNLHSLDSLQISFTNPSKLCEIALNDYSEEPFFHFVSKQDTLQGLAIRHRMSVGQMKRENQILGDILHTGQKLTFPKQNACSKCVDWANQDDRSQDVQNDVDNQTEERSSADISFDLLGKENPEIPAPAGGPSLAQAEQEIQKLKMITLKEEKLKPVQLIRGPSDILTEKEIQQIEALVLPDHWKGYNWELMYSVVRDGSLYFQFFECLKHTKPTFIVIKTTRSEIFGGFVTSEWEPQTGYFGTGECFLWKLQKNETGNASYLKYSWTKANSFFIYCQENCFGMGGGGGHFGFFIGDDMEQGSTGPSATFGNDMLCSEPKFDILNIEIWSFTAQSDQLKANLERLRRHFRNKAGTNRLYL